MSSISPVDLVLLPMTIFGAPNANIAMDKTISIMIVFLEQAIKTNTPNYLNILRCLQKKYFK